MCQVYLLKKKTESVQVSFESVEYVLPLHPAPFRLPRTKTLDSDCRFPPRLCVSEIVETLSRRRYAKYRPLDFEVIE